MKKKLVCLLLGIVMLMSCVLTGCNKATDSDDDDTTDNSAKTITMWVMTSEETTEKAKELVSAEFTKITKSLYKTNVVLRFCTEDEYYEKLEGSIKALKDYAKLKEEAEKALRAYLKVHDKEKTREELTKDFYAANPQYAQFQNADDEDDENESATEEETVINDYGVTEIKYPDVKENQVDIFYLGGRSNYYAFYKNEWLASLDEELSASSSQLTHYVSPSLLNGVRIDGGVYGIPNNVAVGQYTYMLVDKKMYDDNYNSGIENTKSVLDLEVFLNDIKNLNGNKTPDDPDYVVPLASTFEDCLKMLVWFWDLDYVDASVYEMYYDAERGRNYVVNEKYKVETESGDGEGGGSKKTKELIGYSIGAGMIYKTNADHQYVDKDGNVLNYTYVIDSEGGILRSTANSVAYSAEAKGVGMYLVDENGQTVTPENDKRVILTYDPAESLDAAFVGSHTVETTDGENDLTGTDANGRVKPTYYYSYSQNANFSVLGQVVADPSMWSRGKVEMGFGSLFADSSFRTLYETLKGYSYKGLYGTPKDGQSAAVSFIEGDSRIKLEADREDTVTGKEKGVITRDGKQYYVVVAKYPEASERELYGNMFCVYAESAYLGRSMEVITRLNTNAELRNLLQYGILGQHYELNADGTAHLLTSPESEYGTYRMDIEKTGNCFKAIPSEADGPDAWVYAKMQNNDALINPLLGFDFNDEMKESENTLDVALIRHIRELSAGAQEKIDECATLDALVELLENDDDGFKRQFSKSSGDDKLVKAINKNYDPSQPKGPEVPDQEADTSGESPYAIYYKWMKQYGYLPSTK